MSTRRIYVMEGEEPLLLPSPKSFVNPIIATASIAIRPKRERCKSEGVMCSLFEPRETGFTSNSIFLLL